MTGALDDLPAHELRFHFKAGRTCLDFAATVGERWRRSFERLRTPEDLGRWLVRSSLLETAPPVSELELDQARALREGIYRTAKLGGVGKPAGEDIELINRIAVLAPLAPSVSPDGRVVVWGSEHPVAAALSTIARDAIDLVSGPLARRVRECAAPDCALLFLDASRPGRRRWCAMTACGNSAKTKSYRDRVARTGRGGAR
ncbi:MAG: CGNR zinc finger domain-containing protein [Solirubrobacteraceae bacterium]